MTARAPRPLSVAVLILTLVLTAVLTLLTAATRDHSTDGLLTGQVQQAAVTIGGQVPTVQAQLADAVQVATATDAQPAVFKRFVTPKLSAAGPFAAMSLWRLGPGGARELAHSGQPLALAGAAAQRFFASVHPSTTLYFTNLLAGGSRFGYAEMPPGDSAHLVAYAERNVPGPTHPVTISSSPFSDLRLALYFGPHPDRAALLETTAPGPTGQVATVTIPFGNKALTVVGSATGELGGALLGALPWIVLGVGIVLALTSASTVEYVMRRRVLAEQYAIENARLYREQRGLVAAFQHALLPEVHPLAEVDVAARYVAGVRAVDVGGDWYDLIETHSGRCVLVVGDVSGRGLPAATTMAALRYAIRAYIEQGDDIDTVLTKIGALIDVDRDASFATVLIGELDTKQRSLRLASAGHLPPLLIDATGAHFVELEVAAPIGVRQHRPIAVTTIAAAPGMTFIAYSDGLVERRSEVIDTGLERLRQAARAPGSLEDVVDAVMSGAREEDCEDDTVVLALRW